VAVGLRLLAWTALAFAMAACRAPRAPDVSQQLREHEQSEAFANRKIYRELTPAVLAEIPDQKLEQAIIDFIEYKVAGQENRRRDILAALGPGFRAMDATWRAEIEVAGGGFRQYFRNTRGHFAADAVEGFRLMGAPELAAVMEQAIIIASEEQMLSQPVGQPGGPGRGHDRYRPLDQRFLALARDLGTRRIALIRARPELFVGR
jgi:Domain of unknown function (DUF4375)